MEQFCYLSSIYGLVTGTCLYYISCNLIEFIGLGLAYAGSYRDDILGLLLPALTDPKSTPEVIGLTAAACGLVAVATCDYDVTSSILQVLFDANEADLGNTYFRFLPLALGLCYLGKKEAIETTSVALEVLADPFKSMAQTMLQICAYAGTGDVLLIQKMLHICSEHYELENSNKEVITLILINGTYYMRGKHFRRKNHNYLTSHVIITAGFDIRQVILKMVDCACSSALYNFLRSPVTSSLLASNIFLSTLFSNTLNLCSSLKVRVQVSQPQNNRFSSFLAKIYCVVFNAYYQEQSKEEPSQSCCTETKRPLINESTNKSSMQAVATLGVAVIAMGEEIGTEMSTRIFSQLGRYGEPAIRRAVPLGIALCSMSNPQMSVIDVLNKYSHDSDLEVAHNAIFSMGLVGAGTNNARLATMLRHLAQYHSKYPNHLFMVRLAQGLTHLGKGTMSLSPFHSDGQIMNHVAVAGLLVTLVAFFDVKNTILGKSHYLLYGLVAAMHPRWLVTLNEKLEPLPVSVRVGQYFVTIWLVQVMKMLLMRIIENLSKFKVKRVTANDVVNFKAWWRKFYKLSIMSDSSYGRGVPKDKKVHFKISKVNEFFHCNEQKGKVLCKEFIDSIVLAEVFTIRFPEKSVCAENLPFELPTHLTYNSSRLSINVKKMDDLMKILQYIPDEVKGFYTELYTWPTTNKDSNGSGSKD
ncbi:hypothetical protein ANN_13021 [Periplaneta americana]|uniref:26S proteasome non-ATPase regulatory subunit 2 n=1 Tax=Periplaneta americana TaxID=6978 RepID=A0ABQ8TK83_PERAM|nr:hypothetical protein ANN_13021 [Periplaneta americana]